MGLIERLAAVGGYVLSLHFRRYRALWLVALAVIAIFAADTYLLLAPPSPFPRGATVIIEESESARSSADALFKAGIVRNPWLLALVWRVTGEGSRIPSGAYRFDAPESLVTVAWRLPHGAFGIPPVRITFQEGTTVLDMAAKASKALPEVTMPDFISIGMPYEGYLFPDTYTFQPSATAKSIVEKMRKTFDEKTAPLAPDIVASGHSLSDIIIMASIVEREAARPDDRRMIAGILWNRVERGIPLQVDAVFGYIYSRRTYSPSYGDLEVDSPYNTYTHVGLPPGPISNPSLDAIEAALHPTKSNYLYYLTGRDGLMHYATTYQGHKANLATYLK